MKPKAQQHGAGKHKIRILVVDDHAIVRQGLIKLIETESDLIVYFEAENAKQTLEAMDNQEFDLAIVDISLEGMNGLELTKIIKRRHPNTIVLILSMHNGLFYAQRALQAGASGYVAKYEASENLIAAIRRVLNGKPYISTSKAAQKLMSETKLVIDDKLNTNKRI